MEFVNRVQIPGKNLNIEKFILQGDLSTVSRTVRWRTIEILVKSKLLFAFSTRAYHLRKQQIYETAQSISPSAGKESRVEARARIKYVMVP